MGTRANSADVESENMPDAEQILVGTSGWSYPKGDGTWNGYFYPPGTVDQLEYYCRFFEPVEINSSFYRPPDPRVSPAGQGKHQMAFCSR